MTTWESQLLYVLLFCSIILGPAAGSPTSAAAALLGAAAAQRPAPSTQHSAPESQLLCVLLFCSVILGPTAGSRTPAAAGLLEAPATQRPASSTQHPALSAVGDRRSARQRSRVPPEQRPRTGRRPAEERGAGRWGSVRASGSPPVLTELAVTAPADPSSPFPSPSPPPRRRRRRRRGGNFWRCWGPRFRCWS